MSYITNFMVSSQMKEIELLELDVGVDGFGDFVDFAAELRERHTFSGANSF